MSSTVEQITDENRRLHSELRKTIECQIQRCQNSSQTMSSSTESAIGTLQQQLDMVLKDRDSYRGLLKRTSQELEVLQKSDQVG